MRKYTVTLDFEELDMVCIALEQKIEALQEGSELEQKYQNLIYKLDSIEGTEVNL